ncbi:hypothetical protein [Micromonospora sp. NPDC007230]|uniref:hypothetical protein n=1 Tax=Micromonospora sp. NPDC007230 TaxID=3364237 RepID=UPI0036BED236
MHDESALVGWFAHDLDRGAEGVACPVDEATGEAGVDEDVPDGRGRVCGEQGAFGAVAVG